jgi:hypothetical protein
MKGQGGQPAATWLAYGVGLLIVAAIILGGTVMRKPKATVGQVSIGAHDKVYYTHGATESNAKALGRALQRTGFFNGRGSSVLLTTSMGDQVISFVVSDGAWDRPATVSSFEEIARRVATSIGGFPIHIRLVDTSWSIHKTVQVGKVVIGSKDVVYYLGTATEGDAVRLGQALQNARYLGDLGVTVAVSKDDGTVISFVVGEGVWNRADAVAGFADLVRKVAPAVGGLPVHLELLDVEMEPKKALEVQ